jgi:hypothetical protein
MTVQLRVEPLEQRDVPVTFGTPWPDGQHLTLSFTPDGTSILGTASNLEAALTALDPSARLAVLRAFQTWARETNVNIGLVDDSGAAFGTGTGAQGDIRVGGRALAPDVLAITAPYQPFSAYSGEITLNTAANFGAGGYDLFTAILQESGHALGVGNSPDVASAMFEYYLGARTGFSTSDVGAIRALYGARRADGYERATGNDTLATASAYSGPLTADLTTAADVDVFAFTAEPLTDRVTVHLRAAGLSLVTARVELLDSSGRVLATGVAADPTQNDVTVALNSVRAGQTYFVRVSGARADEFAVGSYELEVNQSAAVTEATDAQVTAHARLRGEYLPADAPEAGAPVPELASGTLDSGAGATASFVLPQSGQVHLVLTADGLAEVVVTGATGHAVGRFAADASRGRSLDLFLTAGAYTVTVRAVSGTQIDFRLGMAVVTDPIGVRPEDPTATPASLAPPPKPPAPSAQPPQPPAGRPPAIPAPTSGSVTLPSPKPQPLPTKPTPQPPPRTSAGGALAPNLFVPPPTRSRTGPVEPIEYVYWY